MHSFIRDSYSVADLNALRKCLEEAGTFHFPALPTGLFPAAHLSAKGAYTGYDNVWVRDNIHVAHAHFACGQSVVAVRAVRSILAYFEKYDAALLFLIYPLDIISPPVADIVLRNIQKYLKGNHGIRRYLLDSFWCADYDINVGEEMRTADVSGDMSARDSLVRLGEEAQWCIFDPIISVIHGKRYSSSGNPEDRDLQLIHFNRSLAQLTGLDSGFEALRCPELYYRRTDISEPHGYRYAPNDVTPLLWTQADLLLAFKEMHRTVSKPAPLLQGRGSWNPRHYQSFPAL